MSPSLLKAEPKKIIWMHVVDLESYPRKQKQEGQEIKKRKKEKII